MVARPAIIIAAALAAASPTTAQMEVAPVADIVAAAEVCRASTGPTGIDEAKLTAAGWAIASASKDGKPVAMPLRVYGKAGSKAILMLPPGSKLCTGVARIADRAAFETAAAALDRAVATPQRAQPNEPDAVLWFPAGHIVQLQLTGKPDAPSVRIGVMSTP